jgi:dolichol-phosphate mannosyltransferase
MKISAVIPAYNERENVGELTIRLKKVLDVLVDSGKVNDFEIIYVYQGNDGGAALLENLKKKIPQLVIKHFPEPLGVGYAFREGFHMVSGDMTHVLTMDADLNHQPESLPEFLHYTNNYDIIVGSRYIAEGKFEEMPMWKIAISKFANVVVSNFFRLGVKDISSGYRVYRKKVIDDIRDNIIYKNFEFYAEALIRAVRRGYTVKEVPIVYKQRKHGKSKLKLSSTGIGYARLVLKPELWRPPQ